MKKKEKEELRRYLEIQKALMEADMKAFNEHSQRFDQKMAKIFQSF